jgi:hypothetical protein
VHRDPCHRLRTKVMPRGHSRSPPWRRTAVGRAVPTPMMPLSPGSCQVSSAHVGCELRRSRSLLQRWRRDPECLASGVQVRWARGRGDLVVGAARAGVFLPTPKLTSASRLIGSGEEGGGVQGEGGYMWWCGCLRGSTGIVVRWMKKCDRKGQS